MAQSIGALRLWSRFLSTSASTASCTPSVAAGSSGRTSFLGRRAKGSLSQTLAFCNTHKADFRHDLTKRTCRASLPDDAPFALAIGACLLSTLVLPNVEEDDVKKEESLFGPDDMRSGAMQIISFIPLFNWLVWIFAWLDTGKQRDLAFAMIKASTSFRGPKHVDLVKLLPGTLKFKQTSGFSPYKADNRQFFKRLSIRALDDTKAKEVKETKEAAELKISPSNESTTLPEGAIPEDAGYMRMAVELARKAVGHTSPNPMVGCVIVKDGNIVGRGFHPKAGEPHAEVFALREAGKNARGATAYVSLEPCNHTGRTPPCSQALVRAQVSRVVVGMVDPNPLVGRKGVQTLRKAGIKVVVGVEEALCQATAETFFHRIVPKKPFVTLRYAMSLDGAVLDSEETKRAEAGSHYSRLLQEHDAVIVTDKCIVNNPKLLSSEAGAKQPLRVVIAKSLDLPLDSHVFDTSVSSTLVITDGYAIEKDAQNSSKQSAQSMESTLRSRGVDVVAMNEMNLDAVLDLLYQKGFNSVLLDSTVCNIENHLGSLALSEQGPQKVVVVIAPVIVGNKVDGPGFQLEDDILKLERVTTKACGGDVIVEGYVSKRSSS